ncbi:MAG: hypothetical protein LBQ27_06340 [Clostridiales bacterium]|jgi:hypothetical protein|nr:hypothetical protein [Clostridiales bacterium]
MKNFFERTKNKAVTFFICFYAKHKKRLTGLWTAVGIVMLLGIISGSSEIFPIDWAVFLKSSGVYGFGGRFASNFFLHIAYFALVYTAVIGRYFSVAGYITVFFTAFKLGAGMSALTALYGFSGFVNAVLIYLPVNVVLLATLSSYLLVCMENCCGNGINRIKSCYIDALKLSLYFLPVVLVIDIIAFVILL